MRKIVVVALGFMLSSMLFAQGAGQTFTLTVWVDKGCGGEYFVGEMLTVHWRASHACEITFWEVEPDGKKRKLTTQPVISGAGEGSRGWTLKDYGYGKRAIYAEASSLWGSDTAQCEYYVLQKAADIEVKVTDQDGEPIAEAAVLLNKTAVASTNTTGMSTIPEVEFGEHEVTVRVGDEEQSSRIRIASTQTQYLDFVFTVEKRGSIQVEVFNQHGDPLEADVYIDGFKEGSTSSDGVFVIDVSEGSHFVEVAFENEKASRSVAVVRNQTSFADFTIHIEVETTLTVTVQDAAGNAVADAVVYLDNIFIGRTDAQGTVRETASPGSRTVRVEKQGYQSASQPVNITEGDNSITVAVTEEDAAAYGILVLLGFLLLLNHKR